jgi:chemotaxis protein MotB
VRARLATVGEADHPPEYWITFSDLMVSLLMVFALLMFLALGKAQQETKVAQALVESNARAVREAGTALDQNGTAIVLDSATGTLTMNSELLFAYGSSRLRPKADSLVRQIAVSLVPQLLRQPTVDSLLEEIVVEGHTDTVGSYMFNLKLSQDRAYSVMAAMLDAQQGPELAARLRELIVASGKSESHPIYIAGNIIDAARSRRIEIHFRFRNDAILKRLIEETVSQARR